MKLITYLLSVSAALAVLQTTGLRGKVIESAKATSMLQVPTDCSFMKGYLRSYDEKTGLASNVYLVLNRHALSIFEDENVSQLMCAVSLKQLKSPLLQTECLNISAEEESYKLCSENGDDIQIWSQSILHFQRCSQEESLIEQFELSSSEEERRQQEAEKEELQRKAEEIIERVKQAEDLERENKVKMSEELNRAKAELEKIKEQREYLEKAMEAKAIEESFLAEQLIRREKQKEEVAELEAAAQRIEQQKKEEAAQLLEQQKQLVESKEREARKELHEMVSMAVKAGDKQNAHYCWQEDLRGGQNTALMSSLCSQSYSHTDDIYELELQNCMQPELFCKYCCEAFIGIEFMQERKVCQFDKCMPLISSIV
jgi:chemotaxis protein histidine kinase CheA